MTREKLIQSIEEKYEQLGENPDIYLNGLLQAKPINYWDYVETETLLSLQKPRTDFKDEMIFIMYHQVTELVLKMMVHELEQLVFEDLGDDIWVDKINRLNRYTGLLINSFDVMRSGMNYDDYNTFRHTLAPASGFQSVQFRYIEIYCTPLVNLINENGKERLSPTPDMDEYFEHIYWKDAGLNRKTGKKTLTLRQFEEKYLGNLKSLAQKVSGHTLQEKFAAMASPSPELTDKMREFDRMYNVEWPLVHLQTARHYLDSKGEEKAATGGSEWKKYLHPKFQQRKFFPELWTENEVASWGDES
ncbi:MAG: tryptophan 2,3-dioxygenase [Cryomorphaceae bacterium]|nr:MAG: tryptophan 2,3-dioxygenase [Cryomorphaceae bacterium]